MKIPRDLSGKKLIAALCRDWGYVKVNQVGDHVILQTKTPFPHRIAIPDHKTLRIGTPNAILRSISRHKGTDRETLLNSL